ncbi:MAG: carboxypeptidase regulatory-like domain-containing protein, partial [Acidobacteria bacterium]|nr:carboxypeptidase regulatory-like domain-containing protein [Acidobacteriota bacterium]
MTNLTLTYPETYMTGNITITGNLDLGPETLNTTNTAGNTNYTITLAPGATVTRMGSGMVTGTLEKQYTGPTTFTYPVGTLNGYSPVTANVTSSSNPSSLSVQAVQGIEPNANPQNTALQRYWTINKTSGTLTSNLTFQYLASDVPSGTQESSEHLNQWEGFWFQPAATTNTTNHTASTTVPVSNFSDWTLLPLAPTAADVSVSGRAFAADGSALRGVRVALSDASGHTFNAITNAFGYYSFENVPSGASYLLNGSARGYVFTPRVVTVSDQLTNVDLTALP